MKVRQNLYIEREVGDALEALASGPGGNKSRLVNDAVAAWLGRRGAKEVDDLAKSRFDRLSRDIARLLRNQEVLLESHALLVRYQLIVAALLPEADTVVLPQASTFEWRIESRAREGR